jgi:hypothetical protein
MQLILAAKQLNAYGNLNASSQPLMCWKALQTCHLILAKNGLKRLKIHAVASLLAGEACAPSKNTNG